MTTDQLNQLEAAELASFARLQAHDKARIGLHMEWRLAYTAWQQARRELQERKIVKATYTFRDH